jgi:hypothetical protein
VDSQSGGTWRQSVHVAEQWIIPQNHIATFQCAPQVATVPSISELPAAVLCAIQPPIAARE